jgi:DNA-binding CsgD family transcriptional regulator
VGLLERAASLETIAGQLTAVGSGGGRMVLVSGEPGVGKTALVAEFCATHLDGSRVLLGRCDDLFAPRPLGPLVDIARQCPAGSRLRQALAGDDRAAAFEAFLDELAGAPAPVVAVVEDLQWADEATLDLVRFVARRLPGVPCLVIVTYRDDLDRDHPLRLALGDLVPPTVTRVTLGPLSVDAVRAMTTGSGTAIDPAELHAVTGGNPFFVTEVIDGGGDDVPATVRDAVMGRAGRLTPGARDVLDAAAVLGVAARSDDIARVAGTAGPADVDECVTRGFLRDDGGALGYAHDLARLAIEGAITPWRRRQLHARALAALGDGPGGGDVVRRANHAIAADDSAAVLALAPRAAEQCRALGAHRQAATLLGGAIRYAGDLDPERRAAVFEARARACARIDQLDEAIAAGVEVLAHHRATSDVRRLASWLTWLAGTHRAAGNATAANTAIAEAVTLLEPFGESADLARALAVLAQQHMVLAASRAAVDVGERAVAMAERVGAQDVAIHALNTVGSARSCLGDENAGRDLLFRSLELARATGLEFDVARAFNNLQWSFVAGFLPRDADRIFAEGHPIAVDGELRFFQLCMLADRATTLVLETRWDDAIDQARAVLGQLGMADVHRIGALTAIGRVRARRGDDDPFGPLDEALDLARPYGELQLEHPIRMARAEAAWLADDVARAGREVAATRAAVIEAGWPWFAGETALWCHRGGIETDGNTDPPIAKPFALHLAGRHREAAAAWRERGCRYEEADALGDSDDEDDLRAALEFLHALGARPRATQVARRLRQLGARSLPRGPRPATKANPAGLTARELDVLALLCEDLRNIEIADRLVLSPKTVDHHVSAILSKLAVDNRREAARAAAALGLDRYGESATAR